MTCIYLHERVLELRIFGVLRVLLEQDVTVASEQLGRLGRTVELFGDGVVVDETTTGLVQRGHEALVVVEGGEHEEIVLFVNVQDRVHVQLGVLRDSA